MEIKLTLKSPDSKERLGFYLDGTQSVVAEAYKVLQEHFKEKGFVVVDPK